MKPSQSDTNFDPLLLSNQICHPLYTATNALIRAYRPLLEPLDLTYPQYLVMLVLWQQDGLSVKAISGETKLDAGTLTPILKRLEAKDLLERQIDLDDERQKTVVLTPGGKRLRKRADTVPELLACRVDMNLDQALELKALAEKLYQSLVRD